MLMAGTVRRSSGWEPRAFARQVFERAARKHWGKCAHFVTSARDPLESNVCSHTVGVMVSCPSPTSRSGRRLGVRHGGRSGFVRNVVRRLIAWAMALGRPGLLGWTRELAQGVPHAGSSVPSHARRTLVGMDRTPHLERLVAPASGGSGTGFGRRLRARLAGSSRARLTRSLSLRDSVVRRPALRSRIPPLALNSVVDINRSRDRGQLAGSPRACLARARHTVDLVDLAAAVTCRMTPTPTTRRSGLTMSSATSDT